MSEEKEVKEEKKVKKKKEKEQDDLAKKVQVLEQIIITQRKEMEEIKKAVSGMAQVISKIGEVVKSQSSQQGGFDPLKAELLKAVFEGARPPSILEKLMVEQLATSLAFNKVMLFGVAKKLGLELGEIMGSIFGEKSEKQKEKSESGHYDYHHD